MLSDLGSRNTAWIRTVEEIRSGFALCRRAALDACEQGARSLSLHLQAQWKGLESNGQFRFTMPTHALLAFRRALTELEDEGGVAGHQARYQANHARILC